MFDELGCIIRWHGLIFRGSSCLPWRWNLARRWLPLSLREGGKCRQRRAYDG